MTISKKKYNSASEFIAETSFTLWSSKEFRLLVDFNNINQTEQDRIFNELEVTALGFAVLYSIQTNRSDIRNTVANEFTDFMKNVGIQKQFLDIWKKLIDLRFKEYSEDYQQAYETSKNWKEFKGEERLHKAWSRIETLAIDGWTHIRRGKTEEGDPLWKLLRKWLVTVDVTLIGILDLKELTIPSEKAN